MPQQSAINIDQVLDELDKLARSSISNEEFYNRFMQQLLVTVDATSVAIVIPATGDSWIVRAIVGNVDLQLADSIRTTHRESSEVLQSGQQLAGRTSSGNWYAVPVSSASLAKGILVASYSMSLSDTERLGLAEIQGAFCELVSERQSVAIDRFFSEELAKVYEICNCLEGCESNLAASQFVVNGLASILSSCRVSLSEVSTFGLSKPVAVSAVSKIDTKSIVFQQIQSLTQEVVERKGVIVSRKEREDQQSGVRQIGPENDTIFLPLEHQANDIRWILGFEFSDHIAFANGCSKLPYVLPAISTAWKQKVAWLDLPSWIRRMPFSTARLRSSVVSLTKTIVLSLLVLAFVIWMLKPTALLIEAEGTLLPSESKAIFASADGFISKLLVTDNQEVEAGQLLLSVASPSLELQLEELRGKIRAFEEESRGIAIAMNQLEPNSDDLLKQQSLMASKLKELAIQLQSLERQKLIVESQRESLEVRSPIKGIAVGKDLQQNLLGRPVNRGELLFRVMDVTSDWELRLKVTDQDSNHVIETYAKSPNDQPNKIEFVLDSYSQERQTATLKSIANRVENFHREGNFLEVRANSEGLAEEKRKIGGNVHAYFNCGKFPTWYVWFRPIIDAARRKLWF